MFKSLVFSALVLILAGCHSDPYAGAREPLSPNPVRGKPVDQVMSISGVPPPIDMPEGATLALPIQGHVPTGVPQLAFANCPTFAVCDAKQGLITLSPQAGDATDPNDAKSATRVYRIDVTLASSDAPASFIGQSILVTVHRQSQAGSLTVTGFMTSAQISEGTPFQNTIQVTSGTSTGPFILSGIDLPPGLTFSKTADPTKFTITYSPSFSTIMNSNSDLRCYYATGKMCVYLKWALNVVDPNGNLQSLPASWTVVDVRQDPLLTVPPTVTANPLGATFLMQVQDPNGETIPRVSIAQPVPGNVTFKTVNSSSGSSNSAPFALVQVDWTGVPATFKGTTQTLNVKACVYDQNQLFYQCKTAPVTVSF